MKSNRSWKEQLKTWWTHWQPPEPALLAGVSVLLGLGAGAGIWLFKQLIALTNSAAFGSLGGWLHPLGAWTVALVPALGGLLVGLIVHRFVGPERQPGVAGVMETVALIGGRLRYRRMPAKAVSAAISIGVGASVGPEDPSVQIGANLGSMFGQLLHFSDERVRALVAAGAGAGIAATFNAPIAGVFFALEIILGDFASNAFSVVVVAAVVSAVFTQALVGPQPAFHVPSYSLRSGWELLLYPGLGLLAGGMSALYIGVIFASRDFFQRLHLPGWLKPAIAGLVVGLVGIFLPEIFGVGYGTIGSILSNQRFTIAFLILLLAAKLLMTGVSIGGGFPGGVFAPSLFLGAVLGAAYGQLANLVFPSLQIVPQAFAMVGMAAVLAGAVRAPITAIILPFEMTNDYRVILPLMFGVVMSLLVSKRIQPESIYTLGLMRKGIRLERGRVVEVLEGITVSEVMEQQPPFLYASDTLERAAEMLEKTRRHGLAVLDDFGRLVGMITLQDLDRMDPHQENTPRTVGEVATHELLVTYPDETLGAALRRMGVRDVGRLPVVSRSNPQQLLGLLRRVDIVRAYDLALSRRASVRHRAEEIRLGAISAMDVKEMRVQAGSVCAGKQVSEIPWPSDCVVATLRRGSRVLVPHGSTVLQPGDVLVVVSDEQSSTDVVKLCTPDDDHSQRQA